MVRPITEAESYVCETGKSMNGSDENGEERRGGRGFGNGPRADQARVGRKTGREIVRSKKSL
jgi:hypothetical protein